VGTPATGRLAAFDPPSPELHTRIRRRECHASSLEPCLRQDEETTQLVLVHVPDRLEYLTIDGHSPTSSNIRYREQPHGCAPVLEHPANRWAQAIGVPITQPVSGTLDDRADATQPHQLILVDVRHDARRRGITSTAIVPHPRRKLGHRPSGDKDLAHRPPAPERAARHRPLRPGIVDGELIRRRLPRRSRRCRARQSRSTQPRSASRIRCDSRR